MKKSQLDEVQIKNMDDLVRSGNGQKVKEFLDQLSPSGIPRKLKSDLAQIALRVGNSQLAFSLLRPLIDSETNVEPASEMERLRYALSLNQLGAPEHALKILSELEKSQMPETWLYAAVTLFSQWRYDEAIPKLQKYLSFDSLSSYQRLVGQLNLISAFVFVGNYQDALANIELVESESLKNQHFLLTGNALELKAQVHLANRDFSAAEIALKDSKTYLKDSSIVYNLWLEKWTAVLFVLKSEGSFDSLMHLKKVRSHAYDNQQWETARECDLYYSIGKKDAHLFNYVYFGTPFKPYRARALKLFPTSLEIPETFVWYGSPDSPDVLPPVTEWKSSNSIVSRILQVLSLDFYVPTKPFSLFLSLFPDDLSDVDSGLRRIFSNIARAKKWLSENNYPLDIEKLEGGYRLVWKGPFGLVRKEESDFSDKASKVMSQLHDHFRSQSFSTSEAMAVVSIPRRSLIRILQAQVQSGELITLGTGNQQAYRFKI